jgi:hypothetical protein
MTRSYRPLQHKDDPAAAARPGDRDEIPADRYGEDDQPPEEGRPYVRAGRGCGWFVLLALSATLVLVLGLGFLINRISSQRLVQMIRQNFQEVSLTPTSASVQPAQAERQLQIYYIVRGRALAPENRQLRNAATPAERIELISEEVSKPPATGFLQSPLPPGAIIRGKYVLGGVLWLDLSGDFLKAPNPTPLQERLAIYALVNSFMLNEPSLKGVQFMIDGKPVTTAWGWLDLSAPLGPDLALIR